MNNPLDASHVPEPGRIHRQARAVDQSGLMRWLPGLQTLRSYKAAWLPSDIVAGLVLTTMLVPVGIAYAVASGVPGIYGLYATIIPLLAYALFGPSRILVLGPDSSLAAVILAVVLPLSGGDPMRAIAIAAMMANAIAIDVALFLLGFATAPIAAAVFYLTSQHFRSRHQVVIFGAIMSVQLIAEGGGTTVAGLLLDAGAFVAVWAAVFLLLGLVLLLVATNARRAFTHEPVPRTDAFLAVRAG